MNDPNAMATAIGHLDRVRQRQYSTKPAYAPPQASIPITETSARPTDTSDNDTEDNDAVEEDEFFDVYTKLVAASDINHSDLTGRFPTTSRRGNQYLLVSVWNGYVHMEPQASRADAEYLKSFKATIEFFRKRGNSNIRIQRLDNETSQLLDRYLREAVEHVQYLPPANHRANKAERAIRDSKNHIISILATTHPSFPTAQWDELIEQGELTLNHLATSLPTRPNNLCLRRTSPCQIRLLSPPNSTARHTSART
jgi:transposase